MEVRSILGVINNRSELGLVRIAYTVQLPPRELAGGCVWYLRIAFEYVSKYLTATQILETANQQMAILLPVHARDRSCSSISY